MTMSTATELLQTADDLRQKAAALRALEEVTLQLREVERQYQDAIEQAGEAGCSLRQIGQAAGLSWNSAGYRLKHGLPTNGRQRS